MKLTLGLHFSFSVSRTSGGWAAVLQRCCSWFTWVRLPRSRPAELDSPGFPGPTGPTAGMVQKGIREIQVSSEGSHICHDVGTIYRKCKCFVSSVHAGSKSLFYFLNAGLQLFTPTLLLWHVMFITMCRWGWWAEQGPKRSTRWPGPPRKARSEGGYWSSGASWTPRH